MIKVLVFMGYMAYGDYLSYSGMVNFLSDYYDEIYYMYPKHTHLKLLKLIYARNKKVKFFTGTGEIKNKNIDVLDPTYNSDYKDNNLTYVNFFNKDNKIGKFLGLTNVNLDNTDNATGFYCTNYLPSNLRYTKFSLVRDDENETILFNRVVKNNNYIVVCQYDTILINDKYLPKECDVINLHYLAPNIAHLLKIIENAREIHLVENSIALLVYYMQLSASFVSDKKIYIHIYARKRSDYFINMLKNPILSNWVFIE